MLAKYASVRTVHSGNVATLRGLTGLVVCYCDIWPTFIDWGSAGLTSPSGSAFAGCSIAFGITAAVAAWSVLWHWVTTPPPTTTDWQPHWGFTVLRPDICSQSIYFTLTYRSEP